MKDGAEIIRRHTQPFREVHHAYILHIMPLNIVNDSVHLVARSAARLVYARLVRHKLCRKRAELSIPDKLCPQTCAEQPREPRRVYRCRARGRAFQRCQSLLIAEAVSLVEACGKLVRGVEKLQCRRGKVQLVQRAQFSRRAEAQHLLPVTGVHLRVQRPERRPLRAQTGHAQPASGKPAAQRLKPRAYLHRRGRAEYDEIQPCLLRLPYERPYALSGKLRAQPLQSLRQL